jgi:hypothetical protein
MEEAGGDLSAFAAMIPIMLQRFPAWTAYLDEVSQAAPAGPPISENIPDLEAVSDQLHQTDFVADALLALAAHFPTWLGWLRPVIAALGT